MNSLGVKKLQCVETMDDYIFPSINNKFYFFLKRFIVFTALCICLFALFFNIYGVKPKITAVLHTCNESHYLQ